MTKSSSLHELISKYHLSVVDATTREELEAMPKSCLFPPYLYGLASFDVRLRRGETTEFMGRRQALFEAEVEKERTPEALNRLAMALNANLDTRGSVDLFREAVDKGSHNAMINLFTVYWSIEFNYDLAVDYLLEVEKKDSPSLKCLFNLALLYYLGRSIPENKLRKNIKRSIRILERIVAYKHDESSWDENEICVFDEAQKFLNSIK